MIKYNYEVSVNENRAKLNKDIFLFRGNRNIHYYFSIKGARFAFEKEGDLIENANAIYAAVTVIKPNGVEVANAIAPVENGLIHLKVTEDLIDEEVEIGDFDLVFDLFDDSDGAVTIPKIKGQFHVQERPCTTSIGTLSGNVNVVNQAVVDLAIATQENEQLIVVDDDGKYVKTTWVKGDKISIERLNKIEEGIEKNSTQYKDIANKIESGNIGNNVEPLDDDLPNVYITGTLPTSKSQGDLPITIHYISKTLDFKNYGTLKVQGASSAGYPKKNFTLKLYEDKTLTTKVKRAFKNWGKLNKFVLKAHWMDCSHVRNVGTAKIWGKIAKSRSDFNTLPEEFKNSPNAGATDGFTVRVFVNGIYHGLYEWIVPKDKLFGQDGDNVNHSIATTELNNQPSCAFATTTPTINANWSEELQDTMSPAISTSLTNFIKFVAGSTDEDFVANAENYFDVQSVIDYTIFARIFCIVDNLCKNQIFFTYDGTKWYEGVWDLDAVLGLPPTTRGFYAYNTEYQNGYVAYHDYQITNMLYKRVETLFMDRFKTRYKELRADILSIEGILDVYEKLTNVIKTYDGLLEEDYAATTGEGKFTAIPYQKENNIQQIRTFIAKRLIYMDECINNIRAAVPCTNITLNNNTLTLTNTTPQTLIATLTPIDTTDTVVWSVSPTGICSVKNGVVKPIKNGTCVITATCGTKSATCNVTVSGITVEDKKYVTDGLFADYDLRQLQPSAITVEDLSGNNNTFSVNSGTIQKDDKGGLIGASDLQIAYNSFNPQTTEATIEYTIKYTGIDNCEQGQSYLNRTCGIDGSDGKGYYMWLGGASYNIFKNNTRIVQDVQLTNKLVKGQYYHVVITYTETDAKLYINNELISTHTHTISGIPEQCNYYIGNTGSGGSTAQTLYSTRFYNKTLTTEEIAQNYQYEFNKLGVETN